MSNSFCSATRQIIRLVFGGSFGFELSLSCLLCSLFSLLSPLFSLRSSLLSLLVSLRCFIVSLPSPLFYHCSSLCSSLFSLLFFIYRLRHCRRPILVFRDWSSSSEFEAQGSSLRSSRLGDLGSRGLESLVAPRNECLEDRGSRR